MSTRVEPLSWRLILRRRRLPSHPDKSHKSSDRKRKDGPKKSKHLLSLFSEQQKKIINAPIEDRTQDLSLTKRTLRQLSYRSRAPLSNLGSNQGPFD